MRHGLQASAVRSSLACVELGRLRRRGFESRARSRAPVSCAANAFSTWRSAPAQAAAHQRQHDVVAERQA